MNKFILLFLAVALPAAIFAQETGVCGTMPTEASMQRTLRNRDTYLANPTQTRNVVTYVPVKFHLIGKADKTQVISEGRVLDMLCRLNEAYADQDIQFYIRNGFNYIYNDAAYSNPGDAPLVLSGNRDNQAINVYLGLNANPPSGGGLGTTLGYYSTQNDWLVIKKSEVSYSASTLPHEVGHYFSLDHPFNGWDCTAWTAAEFGNPVSITTAPCFPVPVELADGSNCGSSGDFLCDTPADYNLGFLNGNSCVYSGNCMDPTGTPLDPMENNWMSYFNGCSDYQFTNQQKGLVAADLDSRLNLQTNFSPKATEITGVPQPLSPINGAVTDGYNNINFSWTEVEGANQYFLEIDQLPNFSLNPKRMTVWGTSKVVTGLNPNLTYYWRVRAFNEYATCTDYSLGATFVSGLTTSTDESALVNGWEVMPNPVNSGATLTLTLEAAQSFEANVQLANLSGQVLYQTSRQVPQGATALELPTANLAPGLYLVSVKTGDAVLTRRVVVSR